MSALDLASWFDLGRAVWLLAFGAWLAWLWRRRPARIGAGTPVALALLWWAVVSFPLQRLYGLYGPGDRLRNLAWCTTAAAGNAPWEAGAVGDRSLEPLWGLLVSTLALRDPARVLAVYPWLPALALTLVGLSLGVASRDPEHPEVTGLRPGLVAFFVLLAAGSPLDSVAHFRDFFSRNFLLKPNHSLGLALVPLCLAVLARPLGLRGTGVLAALLSLLSLAFVVHWALLAGCLVVLAALVLVRRGRADLRRVAPPAALALALSATVAVPYLLYIARAFPHAVSLSAGSAEDPLRSPWGDRAPLSEPALLLATVDGGVLLPLALLGAVVAWRRASRLDLLWLSVLVGAGTAWILEVALYAMGRARVADEVFFFLRFATAVHAGFGAAGLVRHVAGRWSPPGSLPALSAPARLAALLLLALLPLAQPVWSDPPRRDVHFQRALEPLPAHLVGLGEWLRAQTAGTDVVLAGPAVAPWVPALSGRRAWTPPRDEGALAADRSMLQGDEVGRGLLRSRGIRVVLWDPSVESELGVPRSALDDHALLGKGVDIGGGVVAFRVEPGLPEARKPD